MSTREQDAEAINQLAALIERTTPGTLAYEEHVARHKALVEAFEKTYYSTPSTTRSGGGARSGGVKVQKPWRAFPTSVPSITLRD